jgi:hypothetical protein
MTHAQYSLRTFWILLTYSQRLLFSRDPITDFNTRERLGFNQGTCVYTQGIDFATGTFKLECEFTVVLQDGTFSVTVRPPWG